jgi:hypothetical protein
MSGYWDEADDPEADVDLPIPVQNRLVLGGELLPGICELPDGKVGRKLDLKNGPGLEGATATWQGYEPPEIKLVLRMWRPSHRKEFRRIRPQIQPLPGKPPAAPFTVLNEVLNDYGINLVMVEDISFPKQGKTQGEVEVEITCRQWLKPKATGTSTPTKAAVGAPATVHDLKGGKAPALIGPPAPPVPPSQFNTQP